MNEATQIYVLAANLLGPKPQPVPPRGEPTRDELRAAQGGGHRRLRQRARRAGERVPPRSAPRCRRAAIRRRRAAFGIGRTAVLLHPAERRAAVVLGPGGGPAVQAPPLHEHRGRRPHPGAVRPAHRPRRARPGRRRRPRHRRHRQQRQPARLDGAGAGCCCRPRRSCATRSPSLGAAVLAAAEKEDAEHARRAAPAPRDARPRAGARRPLPGVEGGRGRHRRSSWPAGRPCSSATAHFKRILGAPDGEIDEPAGRRPPAPRADRGDVRGRLRRARRRSTAGPSSGRTTARRPRSAA